MPHPLENQTCRVINGRGIGTEARIVDGYAGLIRDRDGMLAPEFDYILMVQVTKSPPHQPPDRNMVGRIVPVRASNVRISPEPTRPVPSGGDIGQLMDLLREWFHAHDRPFESIRRYGDVDRELRSLVGGVAAEDPQGYV